MSEETGAVSRKRKRQQQATASTPPRKSAKKNPDDSLPPSDSNESSSSGEFDISTWSQEFRQLEQVFRSLNTVYAFCCTRKHFPTTFHNLKSSVENLTNR